MKTLHTLVTGVAVAGIAAFAGLAHAQGHDQHGAAAAVKPVAAPSAEMSEGEVRKIDQAGKKITLKHGPLKNLDMPAMTMAFQVGDPAMLTKVKVGDKVRFVAANPGGKLTITELQSAK